MKASLSPGLSLVCQDSQSRAEEVETADCYARKMGNKVSLITFLEVKEKVRPSFESNFTDLGKVRESELIFCILVQRKKKKRSFSRI